MGMRYQPTGTPEPRDDRDPSPDDAAGSELVDLGESRLPSRLDVPPASVRSLGRRLDPRLAPLVAVAIVVVAILGTGPLAPHPSQTPTPSWSASDPIVAISSTPESTDACPARGATAPTVNVAANTAFPAEGAEAVGTGEAIQDTDVVAPVDRSIQVEAGARMRVTLSDVRCLDLVGIDLFATSHPRSQPLVIRVPAPFERGFRTADFDGPASGDWIVRVSLQLHGSAPGPWAVYLFRLNTGFVTWEAPVPSASTDTPEGPLVTPAVPCGPWPSDSASPPPVDLVVGETAVSGIPGSSRWHGTTVGQHPLDEVAAANVIDLAQPYTLRIADAICATGWQIGAGVLTPGVLTPADPPFTELVYIDSSPDNPGNEPRVAAQNTFAHTPDALGAYVIRASFTFPNGDFETAYWPVRVAVPAGPEAHIAVRPDGDAVTLSVGCGLTVSRSDGTYGSEVCGTSMAAPVGSPQLVLSEGDELRADASGKPIVGWTVTYFDRSAPSPPIGAAICGTALTSGWSGVGFGSLTIPALPPGDWSLSIVLTVKEGDDTYSVPYWAFVKVQGTTSPSPMPSTSPIPQPDCVSGVQ